MAKTIAGMTYTREPLPGEVIRCKTRAGAFIAALVYAGDELIAWDQIQEPDGWDRAKKIDSAIARRERLARDAAAYWRSRGFDVLGPGSGDKADA